MTEYSYGLAMIDIGEGEAGEGISTQMWRTLHWQAKGKNTDRSEYLVE